MHFWHESARDTLDFEGIESILIGKTHLVSMVFVAGVGLLGGYYRYQDRIDDFFRESIAD